jgi:hypothetical protein
MHQQQELDLVQIFRTVTDDFQREFVLATARSCAARCVRPKSGLRLVVSRSNLAGAGNLDKVATRIEEQLPLQAV